MPDYKEMYLTMMRASEKALRLTEEATRVIVEAQQKCEELYLSAEDEAFCASATAPQSKIVEFSRLP